MQTQATDYDLHSAMVHASGEKSRAARNLNKMLDRKYERWIQLLAKCSDNGELEQHWKDAMGSGDIAGCFWAVMTHPLSSGDLIRTAYEDVHMLSHIQGASNRADMKRLKFLETEVAQLMETVNKTRCNHSEQLKQRDELIRRQEHEILKLVSRQTQQNNLQIEDVFKDELRKQKQAAEKRADWAEEQLAQREMQMAQLQEEMRGLKELLLETREEHAAMEQTLSMVLADRDTGPEQASGLDLDGKRILYVGGRSTLTSHMRAMVEAHNGMFQHHDGGIEDSKSRLKCHLAGADMVFCPIDCISHDACLRVKRHCQQQSKQFIPLRSSGLSTFTAGLRLHTAQAVGAVEM